MRRLADPHKESMGVIEDVYEELDADVPFEEFEEAVERKVDQMGGLADEETAAMLIAHELDDGGEVDAIAEIEPGMDEVAFVAEAVSVGELRTFERDGDDPDGRVCNVEVADESGRIRIALWDDMAEAAIDELEAGQVLRISGRPTDGYDGLEVSVDDVRVDEDAEVDVDVLDSYRVEDLSLGLSDVDLTGVVLATDAVRTFDRDDGSEGRVANLTVGDETGRVRVTLWDERADLATEFEPGETVEIVDGYVRERDGDLELHVGSRGDVDRIDADVTYEPETTPIDEAEIGRTVDLSGGVIEAEEIRTFQRDDGSEGQVRNVRIRDDTGEIRVALWGEKAEADVELADRVVVTDAEIQEGWRDDLEASANWRSTVTVLDDAGCAGPGGSGSGSGSSSGQAADAGADAGATGLSAFGDGGSAAGAADADTGPAAGDDADSDPEPDGPVEFTGTVVQAGDPVVLDDGTETRSVETDADVRLGEEVTVRGPERDGRIDAEELF